MASFNWPPNGTIPLYSTFSAFPAPAPNGSLAIALDTDTLYISSGSAWLAIGGTAVPLAVGTIDSQTKSANGGVIALNQLFFQTADSTHPGLLSTGTQTIAGNKTFTGTISASNLSGTNTGDVTLGTANGLSLSSQVLSLGLSSTSTTGALSSTDWNTFNGKQAAGNYITALTGDVVATGPGSVTATIQPLSVTNSKIANATIDLTTKVTGVLPAANGGCPPVTRQIFVDNGRTDSFTADGSFGRPFATISAAISQIITNADNASNHYEITVAPGTYNETLSFNSSLLYSIGFQSSGTAAGGVTSGVTVNSAGTVLTSTSNNTQLSTLVFNGFTFNGSVNLVGSTNGTNFGSVQILFTNCPFNLATGGITLTNINNVYFYDGQIQGTGSTSTFTNIAFAYIEAAEGLKAGTTLNLVDNPGGNVPSQYAGNYLLFSESKNYATMAIDAGSEVDFLLSYQGTGGAVTNNGTIHSWGTNWNGTLTLNNGSTTRFQGDTVLTAPTVNAGATISSRGIMKYAAIDLYGSTASVHIQSRSTTTGYNFNLPSSAGTSGQPLLSGGGGASDMTFGTLGIGAGGTGQTSFASGALSSNGTTLTSGTLSVANGGTGAATLTANNVLLGNGTSALQTVAPGTSGNVLKSNGTTWISAAISSTAPTIQIFTSGSGTYTTPAGVLYLKVKMVGGGGGGGGSGTTPGAATSGGNTTFGSSFLTANGGTLGTAPPGGAGTFAAGGTATGGDLNITGGTGAGKPGGVANATDAGTGGSSIFGFGGPGSTGSATGQEDGRPGVGYGAGGGGASNNAASTGGGGGGGGGSVEKIVSSPSPTYLYAVGTAGAGGSAGTGGNAGGAGTAGIIIVEEYYQ